MTIAKDNLRKKRNPFYKELRRLGHKVLKNKKKYNRKSKKNKKYVGVAYGYVVPPTGPRAGSRKKINKNNGLQPCANALGK